MSAQNSPFSKVTSRDFQERLKQALKRRFGTRRAAAAQIGMSCSSLNQLVNGYYNPTITVVEGIANKCGVTVDWLLKGDAPSAAESVAEYRLKSIAHGFDTAPCAISDGVVVLRLNETLTRSTRIEVFNLSDGDPLVAVGLLAWAQKIVIENSVENEPP